MKYNFPIPFLEFDEERDLSSKTEWWVLDATHTIPAPCPAFISYWPNISRSANLRAAEENSMPTSKGIDFRVLNGCYYVNIPVVKDEQERKEREARYREKMKPWIEDFPGTLAPYIQEAKEIFNRFKVFYDQRERHTDHDFFSFFKDVFLPDQNRIYDIHMQTALCGAMAYFGEFRRACEELLDLKSDDPKFLTLLQGLGSKFVESDLEMWRLSRSALKLGIGDLIKATDATGVVSKLEEVKSGREWLKEFHEFLDFYGWRTPRMTEFANPGWIEEPSPAIRIIQKYLFMEDGDSPELKIRGLSEERKRMEKEVLAMVPVEKREWFEKLMRLGQWSSQWAEDHGFYLDYPHGLSYRLMLLEAGRRFWSKGIVDKAEDVLYLTVEEVITVGEVIGNYDLRSLVEQRRKAYEENLKIEPPLLLARPGVTIEKVMSEAGSDPVLYEQGVGQVAVPKPQLRADLYGIAGSTGVGEGPARVITSESQIDEFQPGEVLVAPTGFSSWSAIIGMAKGVVTNSGGVLSHTGALGRECGTPVVLNCHEATKKIKTGQRIRVDGNLGAVYYIK